MVRTPAGPQVVLLEGQPAQVVTQPLGNLGANFLPSHPEKEPDPCADQAAGPAFFLGGVRNLAVSLSVANGGQCGSTSSVREQASCGSLHVRSRPDSTEPEEADVLPGVLTDGNRVDLG